MNSPISSAFSSELSQTAVNPGSDHRHELRAQALHWLIEPEPKVKAEGVRRLRETWLQAGLGLDTERSLQSQQQIPGRPLRPELVPPLNVKRRAMNTVEGRAVLIHALTHIEFNAMNLALDAIWRFAGMPDAYYSDWLQVAQEEAYHFSLLSEHLTTLGFEYGAFPAHNSLWEMVERTQGDVLARMALVPRTMEARGLDATPAIRAKLAQAGDVAAAQILDIILRDEIGHVAIGNRWFAHLCKERELEPVSCYASLAEQFRAPKMRGPFNMEARRAAGFSEEELLILQS
ncbi:ferritin-like domain-containing protein [soil metagenome]